MGNLGDLRWRSVLIDRDDGVIGVGERGDMLGNSARQVRARDASLYCMSGKAGVSYARKGKVMKKKKIART
jgi:hypothetical protein